MIESIQTFFENAYLFTMTHMWGIIGYVLATLIIFYKERAIQRITSIANSFAELEKKHRAEREADKNLIEQYKSHAAELRKDLKQEREQKGHYKQIADNLQSQIRRAS
jgi:hypothetical protein